MNKVDLSKYKFLDLGSSNGGSLNFGEKMFNGNGLGTEIDISKHKFLKDKGFDFLSCDITNIKNHVHGRVDYILAFDFFEHLNNKDELVKILNNLKIHFKKFIFIKQPYIENLNYLYKEGLNYYWNNWTGHKNLFQISDFINFFHSQNDYRFMHYGYRKKIESLNSTIFVPKNSKKDTHNYDRNIHGFKKKYNNDLSKDLKFFENICVFFSNKLSVHSEIEFISKKLNIKSLSLLKKDLI